MMPRSIRSNQMEDGEGRRPRSSSSSCSPTSRELDSGVKPEVAGKTEEVVGYKEAEEDAFENEVEEEGMGFEGMEMEPEGPAGLFGDSDEEPAASRVGDEAEMERTQMEFGDRVQILPELLDPPTVGFTEEGDELPSEFVLCDSMDLKFAAEKVSHKSENVSLFAPGELLDIDTELFDESSCNGFAENATYPNRVVRWRRGEDGRRECNTRLVEWDDGSLSFFVEGKWYDLGTEPFAEGTELLCIDQQNCLQALHAVRGGYCTVAAPTDESDDEYEMRTVVEPMPTQRKPKTRRVTVLGNPVKEREAKLKKIEEDRRDRELLERRQRSLQERYTLPSLDQLHEEDEETRTSHRPRKRTRPTRRTNRSKRSRPDDYDEDFIEEDGEREMEFGEDYEEDEAEFETEDEEEDEKEDGDNTLMHGSVDEDRGRNLDRGSPQEKEDEETEEEEKAPRGRVVVLSDEEDDDDLSDG